MRSQIADAARKNGQLEVSVLEVGKPVASQWASRWACRRSERDQLRPGVALNADTMLQGSFAGSPLTRKTVCGWSGVNAGKVAKTSVGRLQPVCQDCVVHICPVAHLLARCVHLASATGHSLLRFRIDGNNTGEVQAAAVGTPTNNE